MEILKSTYLTVSTECPVLSFPTDADISNALSLGRLLLLKWIIVQCNYMSMCVYDCLLLEIGFHSICLRIRLVDPNVVLLVAMFNKMTE